MIAFERILCPIDFSDTSARALAHAAVIAKDHKARLTVLHVAPRDDDAIGTPAHVGGALEAPLREQVSAEVRRAIEAAGAGFADPALLVEHGRAHDVIVRCAAARRTDLLVMGTHGRSGVNRLLFGSVTEKVLRTAPCPVLTVPPSLQGATEPEGVFRRILCGIDFSPSATRALTYALALGRRAGGCVTVLHVVEYMDEEEPCEHVDAHIRETRRLLLERARERVHRELAAAPLTGCVVVEEVAAAGRAYRALLDRAASTPQDLIVVGAQGHGGLHLMLYGSNAQHIARAARCPVLTVRVQEDPTPSA